MADLEGKTIATTYRSILNVGTADNQELHASTPRLIEDGAGNDSALWLATTAVALGVDDTGSDFRVIVLVLVRDYSMMHHKMNLDYYLQLS